MALRLLGRIERLYAALDRVFARGYGHHRSDRCLVAYCGHNCGLCAQGGRVSPRICLCRRSMLSLPCSVRMTGSVTALGRGPGMHELQEGVRWKRGDLDARVT